MSGPGPWRPRAPVAGPRNDAAQAKTPSTHTHNTSVTMAHRSASVALLLLAGVSRGQEQASMCTISAWTDRSSAVQAACCGGSAGGQGHRRAQDGDCQLPTECPSPECANVFVPFRRDCGDLIATISSVDPTMEERYNRLDASCQSMLSPDDKTEAREPREPSGLCVQEKVVCVGRGNQQRCHVECAGPEDRVDEASCASRLPPSARQQLHDAIRSSPVVLFGTRNDQATSNAADKDSGEHIDGRGARRRFVGLDRIVRRRLAVIAACGADLLEVRLDGGKNLLIGTIR